MFDENDPGGWGIGEVIKSVAGDYFDFRTAQAAQNVRWFPGGTGGTQYGVGPDGSLYTRGAPAPGAGLSTASSLISSFLPLLLLAGLAYFVVKAVK